jgi:hypothetical protein
MKNIITFLFSILFFSCSSKQEAVNNYLKIQNPVDKAVFIIAEKIPGNEIVNLLQISYQQQESIAIQSMDGESVKLSLNELKDIADKKSQTKSYWSLQDFDNYKNVLIKNGEELWSEEYILASQNIFQDAYRFSEPIRYNDLYFFMVDIRMFPVKTQRDHAVVIMKREKGKWLVVQEIRNPYAIE